MSREEISAAIRAHILETCPPERRGVAFKDSTSLIAIGVLDSVGVFTLLAFLEERFGVEVSEADLGWNTFETVDSITRLVESKLARARLP